MRQKRLFALVLTVAMLASVFAPLTAAADTGNTGVDSSDATFSVVQADNETDGNETDEELTDNETDNESDLDNETDGNETDGNETDGNETDNETESTNFGALVSDYVESQQNESNESLGLSVASFVVANNPGNAPAHAGPPSHAGPPTDDDDDDESDDKRGPPSHAGGPSDDGDDSSDNDDDEKGGGPPSHAGGPK